MGKKKTAAASAAIAIRGERFLSCPLFMEFHPHVPYARASSALHSECGRWHFSVPHQYMICRIWTRAGTALPLFRRIYPRGGIGGRISGGGVNRAVKWH